jgi:Ser/Thr protein kinase RdoA (MazF antagonist)
MNPESQAGSVTRAADDLIAAGTFEGSDTLSQRLAQLGDAAIVTGLLKAAVAQLTAAPVAVEEHAIDYCKVKPSRDINLALSVTLRCRARGTRRRHHVSCTILTTPAEAQRQFEEQSVCAADRRLAGRPELAGFDGLIALVPEMAAVVRIFPVDPGLPALVPITDAQCMTQFFAEHLPECRQDNWRPRDVHWDVVHFKPGRLCTVRYVVTLDHPQDSTLRTREFFGKAFRDERWQQNFDLLHASSEAARRSAGDWLAADPVAVSPEWRFSMQSAVGGRRFSHVFTDLTHDAAGEAELAQVESHLAAVARAVRSMQQAPVRSGPNLDFRTLLAAQDRNLEYLNRSEPQLAAELKELREEMVRRERTIPAGAPGFSHGDFAHGNVLLHGDKVGIIDFDRAGQAEPVYDVAYFLTHLCSYGIRHPRRQPHVSRLCQHFRDAYLSLAPDVDPRRLALYEALDLSAYVLRNFRKQSHQAKWLRWAPQQIAAAWERLNEAAA